MRSNDVQEDLADGIELGQIPPPSPDGSVQMPPMRPERPPHPRLCEFGPCRNYHTFEIQLDAADPHAERGPDGGLLEHARSFHTEVHHYCYPTAGVEMKLGSLPILKCNRYEPRAKDGSFVPVGDLFRFYTKEPEGVRYTSELAAWNQARAEELAAARQRELQAADDLAAMPTPSSTAKDPTP